MEGEDDYLGFGKALADAPGGLQAVQFGHANVHHHDVRFQLFGHGDGFAAGFRLGNNIPAVVRGQKLLEAASNNVVIVSN
jgi:hypothetical protein